MGLLDRMRGGRGSTVSTRLEATAVSVSLMGGQDAHEVVGELAYQDALWRLSDGTLGDRVRYDIVAVLVPEPTNPYDANAIAVQIYGQVVGYLSRATAQEYLPGLQRLMSVRGSYVALGGVIVGGGHYDDGPGRLGVWLEHDPVDFGLRPASFWRPSPPGHPGGDGVMRTGFSEAWLTDAEDDSYDLSWFNALPEADRPAIAKLRELLASDPDPIDRHFQFAELETRLYRLRELYESALAEYDEVCARHDAEMESICEALHGQVGEDPFAGHLPADGYPPAEKEGLGGLQMVGRARPGSLRPTGRTGRGRRGPHQASQPGRSQTGGRSHTKTSLPAGSPHKAVVAATPPGGMPGATNSDAELEVLVCQECGCRFERMRVRGRKPTLCPTCRSSAKTGQGPLR